MKIALIGSASEIKSNRILKLCNSIGKYLSTKNVSLLTGGSYGIPGLVVKACDVNKINIIAYSPDKDEINHNKRFDNLNSKYFSKIKYIKGFTARSLKMIEDSDAVIVIGGRIGTLSEFTIALEGGKKIMVLKKSGGISDHLEYILSVADKKFPNQVFFETDYKKGIDKLLEVINKNI